LTLANDSEPNCRLLASKAVSTLFDQLSASSRAQLLAFMAEWLATPLTTESTVITVAAALQTLGIVAETCSEILSAARETWLLAVLTAIQTAMNVPLTEFSYFMLIEQSTLKELPIWKIVYQGFLALEQLTAASPKMFKVCLNNVLFGS